MIVVVAAGLIGSLSSCALAAIATHPYQSQLVAAADATLDLDLVNAAIAADSYAVAHNGSYSGATLGALESAGLHSNEVPAHFKVAVNASGGSVCMQGATKYGRTTHVDEQGTPAAGPRP